MYEGLKQGRVIVWTEIKRKEFIAFLLPFHRGVALPLTKIFVAEYVGGAMRLVHPPARLSTVPQQVLHLALQAKIEEYGAVADSIVGILKCIERFSHSADDDPCMVTDIARALNVALGGTSSFPKYGRFVPCAVQLERNPFPQKLFACTPCSCDIIPNGRLDKNIRTKLKKLKGEWCGHNYSSQRQHR